MFGEVCVFINTHVSHTWIPHAGVTGIYTPPKYATLAEFYSLLMTLWR